MNEQPKVKRGSFIKISVSLFILAVVAYIVFQVIMVLNPSIVTRTAILYNLNNSISCTALMSMPQEEVYFDGGVPDYLIANGDKVAAGGRIARIFASYEHAQSFTQAQRISQEIKLLQAAQTSTAGVNIESLLLQSHSAMLAILEKTDSGNFLTIPLEKARYQSAINKTQIATGTLENFADRIMKLTEKETILLAESGTPPVIYAPKNGYFVSSKYSQDFACTPEQLQSMSPLQLQEAAKIEPSPVADNVLGRLIYDFQWDCYLSVSSQEANKFIEGKLIYLNFPDYSLSQIPAKIIAINIDEPNKTAKITVSGDYMTADIAAVQLANATITFPYSANKISYTGIRVPKESLRAVNGEYGVYIRYGNLAQYRRIEIMFENENYILTPLEYKKNTNELRLFDEIIVEGRGLLPQLPQSSELPQQSSSSSNSTS